MYHNLFRITLLCTTLAIILAACGAPATVQPITLAPATEAISIATEIAPTNTLEPTATQVLLGIVTGRIAFQSSRDGNKEIYVMNGDGSGLTNLTDNLADDDAPFWSPDGKRIAFQSSREGNVEVFVMNTDGSNLTQLTDNPSEDAVDGWSPDGKKILFHNCHNNCEVYVMNADGSGQTNLTNS
jgi:TolB protein